MKTNYSDKANVNILTSLLIAHGVEQAVVCPGSRNAPIVHNLVTCRQMTCHSVVDERSAGFYALGMAQCTGKPVVVCVTSGSALLNVLPAVAEAFYQRLPLVVISADRPPQWIDQLDGQTLPQPDALGRFVRKAVTLPEPHDDEERWWCNRLVNEALIATQRQGGGPVHINVPLTEPLYCFNVPALPSERMVFSASPRSDRRLLTEMASGFWGARRPLVVVGQTPAHKLSADDFCGISGFAVVLNESLSIGCGACHFDELLSRESLPKELIPDFVLCLGDTLVSRRLKDFLRQLPADVPLWMVSEDGELRDTFKNMCGLVEGHPADVLADLMAMRPSMREPKESPYFCLWNELLAEIDERIEDFRPAYSQMAAVKLLEEQLVDASDAVMHYANSMAVRLANVYSAGYVFCNRGVNGIEGSLSAAAGFSLLTSERVFCVVGDLSFFYDANALWSGELRSNLRVLLLNNGGGGIFEKFQGLCGSAARDGYVMARHEATAGGLCESLGISHRIARDMPSLADGLKWLTTTDLSPTTGRPLLLEVLTDSASDAEVFRQYAEFVKR